MGVDNNGKHKSDKETQSPLQNIFREMIEREKRSPDEENLLKDQREDVISQAPQHTRVSPRCCESGGLDHKIKAHQYNIEMKRQNAFKEDKRTKHDMTSIINQRASHEIKAYNSQAEREAEKLRSDETCSCYSCALKNLAASEFSGTGCLIVLFLIASVIAFFLVYSTAPHVMVASAEKEPLDAYELDKKFDFDAQVPDSVNFRRRLEALNQKGVSLRSGYSDDVGEIAGYKSNRKFWDDTEARDMAALMGYDTSAYGLQDSESSEDGQRVFRISEGDPNSDAMSDKLKSFYKKFLQTDAVIRNIKKNAYELDRSRQKRSLKPQSNIIAKNNDGSDEIGNSGHVEAHSNAWRKAWLKTPSQLNGKRSNGSAIQKRSDKKCEANSSMPSHIVIEKKKLFVHLDPNDNVRLSNVIPKCSHTPSQMKSHEKERVHPFYKNTQRLDEFLDKFIDVNMPELLKDQFSLDFLLNGNRSMEHSPLKHSGQGGVGRKIEAVPPLNADETCLDEKDDVNGGVLRDGRGINVTRNEVKELVNGSDKADFDYRSYDDANLTKMYSIDDKVTETLAVTSGAEALVDNQEVDVTNKVEMARDGVHRKLLQLTEDDDSLGQYEYKLVDDVVDDYAPETERVYKRDAADMDSLLSDGSNQNASAVRDQSPNINNPNWKGPMPLYPDEISTIIKNAALQKLGNMNFNYKSGDKVPISSKDNPSEADKMESSFSDLENIEDYLNDRYEKVVKMAQAYSDYGVLEGKKDSTQKHQEKNKMLQDSSRIKLELKGDEMYKMKRGPLLNRAVDGVRQIMSDNMPALEKHDTPAQQNPFSLSKHVKFIPHANVNNEKDFTITTRNYSGIKEPEESTSQFISDPRIKLPMSAAKNATHKVKRRLLLSFNEKFVSDGAVDESPDVNVDRLGNANEMLQRTVDKSDSVAEVYDKIDANWRVFSLVFPKKKEKFNAMEPGNDLYENRYSDSASKLDSNATDVDNSTKNSFQKSRLLLSIKDNNNATIHSVNSPTDNRLTNVMHAPKKNMTLNANLTSTNTNGSALNKNGKYDNSLKKNSKPISAGVYNNSKYHSPHRSRTLLSITEDSNVTDFNNNIVDNLTNLRQVSDAKFTLKANVTELDEDRSNDKLSSDGVSKPLNKTLAKRAINEGNLVFWNDLYDDDEYGVSVNSVKDYDLKRVMLATEPNPVLVQSNDWFKSKISKVKKLLRTKAGRKTQAHPKSYMRPPKPEQGFRVVRVRRSDPPLDDDFIQPQPVALSIQETNFEALTANMKNVLKEAVDAIHSTRSLDSQYNKDLGSDTASSLMQQLVSLMTDLIDYQVQQKTAVRLPPDLRSFLVWLTGPAVEPSTPRTYTVKEPPDFVTQFGNTESDKQTSYDPLDSLTSEPSDTEKEEENLDARSECLGSVQAVETLLEQYNDMSDVDKSKMAGVKDYLKKQLDYLKRQLNIYNKYEAFPPETPLEERYKRSVNGGDHYRPFWKRAEAKRRFENRPRKRRKSKFMKSFNFKKHTKSTTDAFEGGLVITERVQKEDVKKKTMF